MASLPRKPAAAAPTTATPVGGARARELQERIRVLRKMADEARVRLQQAHERNRHQLQAELEHAERACRQAERQMAELRARALAAGPAPTPRHDPQHPSQELPPEALLRIVKPTASGTRPVREVRELDSGNLDLDLHWNRDAAANAALNLLQQSAESPLVAGTTIRTELPIGTSPEPASSLVDIDFGPLVEEFSPADPEQAADSTVTDRKETKHSASRPQATTAAIATHTPVADSKPGKHRPDTRHPSRPAGGTAAPREVHAGEPVRPQRTARAAQPTPRSRSRRIFRPALLAGLLLGITLVFALIRLGPSWQAQAPSPAAPVPVHPESPQNGATGQHQDTRWRRTLLQQEQAIRQAAHARFKELRERLRQQAALTIPTPAAAASEPVITEAFGTEAPAGPVDAPLTRAPAPEDLMGPPPPAGNQGPVQTLF